MPYVGRFAPSPTGPLHMGSLVTALASWLDAKAHQGQWLIRMEDVDAPRCIPGMGDHILAQLAALGLHSNAPVRYQSQCLDAYQAALTQLLDVGTSYPCACSRKDIETALQAQGSGKPRFGELVYPGTCRHGLQGREARAYRFKIPAQIKPTVWTDRALGPQEQDLMQEVGDFVIRRADGLFAYQLAVVVDDAVQGITHIVRGMDLADNTARQIALQNALGFPRPKYLHIPLVLGEDGAKLSKQNGAKAISLDEPLVALSQAAQFLGLTTSDANTTLAQALANWVGQWQNKPTIFPHD